MSLRAMNRVWERSKATGSELLVLLAIADYAEDDGRHAYPTIETLAAKSRMSERGVRYVLTRLIEADELEVEKNVERRVESRGGRKRIPRQYMHVLCCREPAKIAGSEAAKIAGSEDAEAAKIAGSQEHGSGKPAHREAAKSRTAPPPHLDLSDPLEIRQYTPPKSPPGGGDVCGKPDRARRRHPLDESPTVAPWSLELFDQLWDVYPVQEGRVAAMRAWVTLNPSRELAEFIVAHVRMRLQAGWGRDGPHPPWLGRFLEERRWQERYQAPRAPASSDLPDGLLVVQSCPKCGAAQEGRIVRGRNVFPACDRCGPSDQETNT